MSDYALASGEIDVRGDKTAGFGVVVAGPQVVPLGLFVIDVAPVAEGVQYAQCGCQGARAAELLPPAVIRVFYLSRPAAVNDLDYIPLAVAQVVIIGSVKVHRLDLPRGVVGEAQLVGALCKPDQHAAVVAVIGVGSTGGLPLPQAVGIVDIAGCAADLRQLLPAPGQRLAPVGRGVPHGVVGDGLAVVAGQLVLPGAVPVAVGDRACGRARVRDCGVGVDLLRRQVPPGIVGIDHRLVGELVVLPDQFVGPVVLVGDGGAPPGDGGYVPVVVVSVGVGRVAADIIAGE